MTLRYTLLSLSILLAGAGGGSMVRPYDPVTPLAREPAYAAGAVGGVQDSAALVRALRDTADAFVRYWRYHWEVSDRYRYLSGYERATITFTPGNTVTQVSQDTWPPPAGVDTIVLSTEDSLAVATKWSGTVSRSDLPRIMLTHCHPESSRDSPYQRVSAYVIESGFSRRAICPSWYPAGASPPWDERRGIDNAIIEPLLPRVKERRAELIRLLEDGGTRHPGDAWIAGQRVRFAMDQLDTAAALRAVDECRSATWWCTALRGYMLHLRGETHEADTTFARMLSRMDERLRCEWSDLGLLLDESDAKRYRSEECAGREKLNEVLWWLADAEWDDSVHERRAEHYARVVLSRLRGATTFHERWDMRFSAGGNAVHEMLVRYGWPSFSFWAGLGHDRGHFGYLGVGDWDTQNHGRFATAEYTAPRFRLTPALSAVLDPGGAREFDWLVSGDAHASAHPSDTLWWPPEHAERSSGPIIQLWSQQGLFRRENNVLLALAANFNAGEFGGVAGDTLVGWLHRGYDPREMQSEPASAVVGSTNVMRHSLQPRPQVVSLELRGRRPVGVLARTRFGVKPPPVLSELRGGEVAISAPVFIRPTLQGELPADDPESALDRMFGTVVFRLPSSLGVYWETYGLRSDEGVDLQVAVESRPPPPTAVRRLGIALGFVSRERRHITVEWREERALPAMHFNSGGVPIHGRVMAVNVARLEPGEYTLVVSVRRGSEPPVSARSDFWIVD